MFKKLIKKFKNLISKFKAWNEERRLKKGIGLLFKEIEREEGKPIEEVVKEMESYLEENKPCK